MSPYLGKPRTVPVLLLLVLFFPGAWLPARAPDSEMPELSEREVLAQLRGPERRRWTEAAEMIEEGRELVESGEWYLSRRRSALSRGLSIDTIHAQGREMAAEGKEMVARGEQMQMALREKALQRAAETAATPAEAFVISHSLRESSWPEVLNQLASRVLADLWQNGLSGVYFGGAYVFEDQMYRQVDKLSGAFEDALVRADGTRFSFAGLARIELVKREDGHELVLYPEPGNESRSENPEEAEGEILTADEPGRVTVVVAEIVPGPRDLMPIVSLRAFDLATWQILSAPMRRVSLTPELVEALGVTSPSPEGGSKKIEEVVLKNPSSFIERLQQAPTGAFLFRMDYTGLGLVDPLNQAVPLITKSILAELAGLAVSDYDFLVRAMVLSKGRREAVSGEENAVWLLNFEEEKEEGEAALATLFASRLNDDGQAEPREVAEVRVELGEADRE